MGIAADRGVVDNRPAPPREHPRQHPGGEVGDRDEVDLEHRVDLVDVLLLEQAARDEAGVVEQQIDPAQIVAELRTARVD